MWALACIMLLEKSRGSMMVGADWLSGPDSVADNKPRDGGEASTTLLVLCLVGTHHKHCLVFVDSNSFCCLFLNN